MDTKQYNIRKVHVWLGCFIMQIKRTLQISDYVNVTLFRHLDSILGSAISAMIHRNQENACNMIIECPNHLNYITTPVFRPPPNDVLVCNSPHTLKCSSMPS